MKTTLSQNLKSLSFTLLLLGCTLGSHAQNWFDGTPNWYYKYEWNCITPVLGYDKIWFEKDTTIESIPMKKFVEEVFRNELGYVTHWTTALVLYESDDQVFEYRDGSHVMLYDFTKEVGDSLHIYFDENEFCDPQVTYVLDEIELTTRYNIDDLRVQKWVKVQGEQLPETLDIVEKIGALGPNSFNMSLQWNCGLDQCYPYSFECYYNPAIEGSQYDETCIDRLTSLQSLVQKREDVFIYPNPSNGEFNFVTDQDLTTVETYSVDGQLVQRYSINDQRQIDLKDRQNGLYLVKFITQDGLSLVQSVIKY